MRALVLETTNKLSLRDIEIAESLGPRDVRIAIRNVGICGSDVHYYEHGRIGPFVVREPMVLGHEAAGVVIEAGAEVTRLRVGNRRAGPRGWACTTSTRRCVSGPRRRCTACCVPASSTPRILPLNCRRA
jgi:threonine dehydrogenase-like Zn-dependent dehydrogenase